MFRKFLKVNLNRDKSFIQCTTVLFLVLIINLFFSTTVYSQEEQTKSNDTVKVHSPKKATLMSAVCPGLGQFYNKKYWKIPVIYTSAATLTYFAIKNHKSYTKYKIAYTLRTDGDSTTIDDSPYYNELGLITLRDYYRKNLEVTIILSAALYILNIVDAAVDAHLYDFDVSDDLSMRLEPIIYNSGFSNRVNPGIKLTLSLK